MYQRFTYYWNLARIVVVVGAFGSFALCSLFSSGFAPSLDVANVHEFKQVHDEARDKENKEAHDRVQENNDKGQESSDRDYQKDADYFRDHAV